MTIDFHSARIRGTYASRHADANWKQAMLGLVDPCGTSVADIGCGGGIYSRAWRELSASSVTGIDFSRQMIADAREASDELPGLTFREGTTEHTGLPGTSFDIVFSRAVIHHLPELAPTFAEAFRILKPGGTIIVQDRTMDDVRQPASPENIRGYCFEVFPRLLEIETARRPESAVVVDQLRETGFNGVIALPLYEQRRTYASREELERDLRARSGRSILHELSDEEIELLIHHVIHAVGDRFPLTEADRWTVWTGRKS
ncbi:MAG TPA: class I SAM-dependent methyltransferase [Thermomicrobiales bacterium]|nr:class I SAM-dependent methyltransferase [Thermomicrobiales bacterium]